MRAFSPFAMKSVSFSLEILSLYWNSLPFRGGFMVSSSIRCAKAWIEVYHESQ